MDMKKRSFKKLITLSLTLAMLTGVAGCGKQQSLNAETNPDTPVSDVQFPLKEKAELSFITSAPATSTQDPNERTIFKRMEKQTNVHIDWTCFVSDQFSDKKNLALAQFGNLPDGLFNAGMSDYDLLRYAKQGIIIPVENLIDKYMPNLQAVFEKYPEYRTMCTAPDGHIYSFPWIEQLGSGKEAIQAIGDIPYINKKWLDYLGLDVPTTTDELEVMMLRYAFRNDNIKQHLIHSLPIAGVDGTLKKRMKSGSVHGNVKAKTGTLTGIISLAGYCTAANGHELCFSIINNGIMHGSNARHFADKVCNLLCQP